MSGERLRFEVLATKRGYVTVVGVDGTGKPSVYVPPGVAAIAFDPAASSLLPARARRHLGDDLLRVLERPFSIAP
jgi:hypothetical protein